MAVSTRVLLYGSLKPNSAGDPGAEVFPEHSLPIEELLNQIGVSPGTVQLVMVNHRAVPPGHVVQPGDRVACFPREYMIFADWKNFRS